MVVLTGCDGKSASRVAERMRKSIGDESMDTPEGMIPVTLSLGVAVSRKGEKEDVQSLVRAADDALYQAKKHGRNRVEVSECAERRAPAQKATEPAAPGALARKVA